MADLCRYTCAVFWQAKVKLHCVDVDRNLRSSAVRKAVRWPASRSSWHEGSHWDAWAWGQRQKRWTWVCFRLWCRQLCLLHPLEGGLGQSGRPGWAGRGEEDDMVRTRCTCSRSPHGSENRTRGGHGLPAGGDSHRSERHSPEQRAGDEMEDRHSNAQGSSEGHSERTAGHQQGSSHRSPTDEFPRRPVTRARSRLSSVPLVCESGKTRAEVPHSGMSENQLSNGKKKAQLDKTDPRGVPFVHSIKADGGMLGVWIASLGSWHLDKVQHLFWFLVNLQC